MLPSIDSSANRKIKSSSYPRLLVGETNQAYTRPEHGRGYVVKGRKKEEKTGKEKGGEDWGGEGG